MHVGYLSDYVPVIYALLSNKDENMYERFFRVIKQLFPHAQPQSVLIDFVTAAAIAILTVFQTPGNDLSIEGCFFHLQTHAQRRVEGCVSVCTTKSSFVNI